MKLVYIVWEDACELDDTPWGVQDEDFVYEPTLCHQVGFLLYNGPEGVVISNGVMMDGIVARRNQIPKGMIRSMEWLTEPSFLTEVESE
jgi:hypothetical protein